MSSLERLWLAAWIDGLDRINRSEPAVLPVGEPAEPIRLDDTERCPVVPLRPVGGDRG